MTDDDRDDRLPLAMSDEDLAVTRAMIAGPIYAEYRREATKHETPAGMMRAALRDADALMAASLEREGGDS